MKKISRTLAILSVLFIMLFTVGCTAKEEKGLSYVTIETNPSIELVADENQVVLSVNGLNEDGKLLLEGETIVGLNLEEATQKIIKLTEELGFTFKGTIDENTQEISISVSAELDEVQKAIETKVKDTVNKTIQENNLDLELKVLEEKTRTYFEEIAAKYDPTLTENEVKSISYEELMTKVNEATKEKAEFVSIRLEEYYQTLKEYEFKIYYNEEIVKQLDSTYVELKEKYNTFLTQFETKIQELKNLELDILTNPESSYVQALETFREKKQELAGKKVQYQTNVENGNTLSNIALGVEISVLEQALPLAEQGLLLAEQAIEQSFGLIITSLEQAHQELVKLEQELPDTINTEEILLSAEQYINTNKDELMTKFEESFSEEKLEQIKQDVLTRKQELKEMVQNSKSNN